MGEAVAVSRAGAIGLIAITNPPVNAASHAVRLGLLEAIESLDHDTDIGAIILYGDGRTFIAGADIREFGKPIAAPTLPEICARIEAAGTPIASVLHGTALGGGLEVALSTHARVAIAGAVFGFPEVTLGIIPGAGGTQRAPRLVGMAAALDLIVTGRRIDADTALSLGLVDHVASGDPPEIALKIGADILAGRLPTRRTGEIEVATNDAALSRMRDHLNRTESHLFAPQRCVDAVATSVSPIGAGMAEERRLFQDCISSPQRAGLVHAFFAERAVTKIPEREAKPRDIAEIGVVGAGTMGAGIAAACLLAGFRVVLTDQNAEALTRGAAAVQAHLDGAEQRDKITAELRAALRFSTTPKITDLAGADLIVEAAFEDMQVKEALFENLGTIARPGAVLASNTSYLDLDALARASGRPSDVVGLHFFSPAHVMRLLEVVVGTATAPDVVATGFALAKRMRKVAVRARVCDGFIGNRILNAYRKAADLMMLSGNLPAQIDKAVRGFGFAMGPFETSDLAGLDIGWANRKRIGGQTRLDYTGGVADALCAAGHFGRKTGRGFYLHDGDALAPNPDLPALIATEQDRLGIAPAILSDDEIVDRYLTAMIMEATRVIEDGIALRPIDIDAVFLFGYGFPRWRGGPMHFADTVGASDLLRRIEAYRAEAPNFWTVPALLSRMASDGATFSAMNKEA